MSALIQNTTEWLDYRKGKIGASDAPIVMGVSPWKTRYQLWLEKLDLAESNRESTSMSRGKQLEPIALSMFTLETGIRMEPRVMVHSKYDWMIASLDGLAYDNSMAVEIKCPGWVDHGKALRGEIPDKYFPQLQHQLEVLSLDKIYYYSFDGNDGVLLEQGRDDRYIKSMVVEEADFYDCMMNFRAPEMTERDYQMQHKKENIQIRNDDVWKQTAIQLMETRSELKSMKHLEEKEAELRNSLISMCNGQSTVGAGIKVTGYLKPGSIDYSAIPELKGVDLDKYRKGASQCWRVSVS